MGIGMSDQHGRRAGDRRAPAVHESPSATFRAVSNPVRFASVPPDVIRPANWPGVKSEPFADRVDHRMFDGGRPRPHFVNRHHLVRDAADEIEQRGQRNRRRNLMADVMRMMQVLAAGERFAGDLGNRGACGNLAVGPRESPTHVRPASSKNCAGFADQAARARSSSAL